MPLKFAANLTMLYPELPFLDRFERAASVGFRYVEFLFPYEPGVGNIQAILDKLSLQAVLFNILPGDTGAGEWGLFALPHRTDAWRRGLNLALEAALQLGVNCINVMFGNREPELEPQAQIDCAIKNLAYALPLAKEVGVILLIEPLNAIDRPNYFLTNTAQALSLVQYVNDPNFALLYDVYHAQMSEGNLINTVCGALPWVKHIQFADVPGRHQPGTGEINFQRFFGALEQVGYDGFLGLEYLPLGDTDASFGWMTY